MYTGNGIIWGFQRTALWLICEDVIYKKRQWDVFIYSACLLHKGNPFLIQNTLKAGNSHNHIEFILKWGFYDKVYFATLGQPLFISSISKLEWKMSSSRIAIKGISVGVDQFLASFQQENAPMVSQHICGYFSTQKRMKKRTALNLLDSVRNST